MFYSELDIFAFSYSYLGYLLTALREEEYLWKVVFVHLCGKSHCISIRFIIVFCDNQNYLKKMLFITLCILKYSYDVCLFTLKKVEKGISFPFSNPFT